METLKIIIIQETNWLDRNVIHQHHLAERLAKRGHQIVIVDYDILWPTRSQRKIYRGRQIFEGVNRVIDGVSLDVIRPATVQIPIVCHLSWAVNSIKELRALMIDFKPDVVIGLTLTNSNTIASILKDGDIPYISMVLEPYHTMVPQKYLQWIARLAENRALSNTDRVLVFTPQMQDYVFRSGMPTNRVTVLKTGVSLNLFHPNQDGTEQRQALGISRQAWVLFFMGWLYDFSGLREIVRTIGESPEILQGAYFVIVGDGDLYDELNDFVAEKNLGRNVILTGRKPYSEIPSLVAMADVCLMPSLENETTRDIVPMKVYEYLAAGKPMVAADLPGMQAEFGRNSGILYAEDPIDALKKAIWLKSNPDQVDSRSKAGRRTAEQNADWEKTTDTLEELLFESIDRSTAP